MSHRASHWAIVQLPAGSEAHNTSAAQEKSVLMVLADFHNNETDRCDPSAILVGKLCCCNEKTVRRCLESLQAQGFIWMKKRDRQPSEIWFNWERPGAFEFKKKSTDKVSVEPEEDPARPDWARPAEDQKSTTDTSPVVSKSTDMADPIYGHEEANLRTSDPQSTDTMPDEPVNQVKPGVEPGREAPDEFDDWQPSKRAIDALRIHFGTGFKIPESWRVEFLIYAESRSVSRKELDKSFVNWARYQRVHDSSVQRAEARVGVDAPRPVAHGRGTADVPDESPQDRLRFARRMLADLSARRNSPQHLIDHWQAEVARLESELVTPA